MVPVETPLLVPVEALVAVLSQECLAWGVRLVNRCLLWRE